MIGRAWHRRCGLHLAGLALLLGVSPPAVHAELQLAFEDERLSLDSRAAPLGTIMQDLSRQTGLRIELPAAVADTKVDLKFSRLSLEQGIRRILSGVSYVLSYDPNSPAGSPRLAELRVLASGSGEAATGGATLQIAAPAPPVATQAQGSPEAQRLVQAALSARDPADRVEALDLLVDLEEEIGKTDTFVAAIRDPDPQVRLQALSLLDVLDPGAGKIPIEPVAEAALTDTDLAVRYSALNLLANSFPFEVAHAYLLRAQRDPNPEVAAHVEQLIKMRTLQ